MLLWCYMALSFVLLEIVSLSYIDRNQALTLLRNQNNKVARDENQTTAISNIAARTNSEATTISSLATTDETTTASKHADTLTGTTMTLTAINETANKLNHIKSTDLSIIDLNGLRNMLKDYVITCDGYILNVFRLNSKNREGKKPTQKYPVLLFHGMMQTSDRFIANKNKSVALILEDLGFDVWLGNSRGNKYGRLHLYLEPDMYGEKYQFFNYSYEEIGLYDVGATVDYILDETGAEKLHYIGVSQGGTAFLALNSLQPHFNEKFETAHLLAPLGYQSQFNSVKLRELSKISDDAYKKLLSSGVLEIYPYDTTSPTPYTSPNNCFGDKTYEVACNDLDIVNIMNLDETKFKKLDTRGGSIKQLAHYAQNIRDRSFRRFDHGVEKNQLVYGSNEPPKYDLKLVTVKTVLYYSLNDEYVAAGDVLAMARDMPNARVEEVERKTFDHLDFVTGKDLITCVYEQIFHDMGAGNEYRDKLANEDEDDDEPDSSTKLSLSLVLYALPLLTLKLT